VVERTFDGCPDGALQHHQCETEPHFDINRRLRDRYAAFDTGAVKLKIITMPFVAQIVLTRELCRGFLNPLPYFVSTQMVFPAYFH
jgi:hypothetical protein